ncbi:MAG: VCBS repeat-containing protein [Planctomycetes bacterium]|nr:VCBS repeat-containing protein [Planctomycetota bacterium]
MKTLRNLFALSGLLLLLAAPARAQDDHSNVRSSAATTVVLDGPTVAGTIEVGGDRDWFKFTVPANVHVIVYTTSLGPTMDSILDVYRPNGSYIGGDRNGGGGLASRVDFVPATAGTYYARVIHASTRGTGTYAIGVRTPGPPDPTEPDVGAPRVAAILAAPFAAVLADLDGSGRQAAVLAGRDGLQVVRADARGDLAVGPLLRTPLRPQALLLADVGGDAALDLVTWGRASDTSEEAIFALVADRARPGGFAKPRVLAFGSAPQVGDVDGDGHADLVAIDRLGGPALSLYRHDPAARGEFLEPTAIASAPTGPFCLADLDGDGRLDLADVNGRVFLQDPAAPGRFLPPAALTPAPPASPQGGGIAAGDVDGDGVVDLVVVPSGGRRVTVYRGDPARPGSFLAGLDGVTAPSASGVSGWLEVTLVDVDGDGRLDVVARSSAGSGVVALQDPSQPGRFLAPTTQRLVALGDMTGDGLRDELALDLTPSLASLSVGGPGGTPAAVTLGGIGPIALRAHVVDLDGDGHPDVLTTFADGSVMFHQADVTRPGHLLPGVLLALVAYDAVVEVADLDGDGRLDVVVADSRHDVVHVLLQSAVAGQFAPPVAYPTGGRTPMAIAIGDVDGDGRPDLVIGNFGGFYNTNMAGSGVAVLRQSPALPGRFLAPEVYDPPAPRAEARTVAVGDLDGDGLLDIVAGFHTTNQLAVYRQDPANRGRFLPPVAVDGGRGPEKVVVTDLDRDGRLDVVLATRDHPTIKVWYGQPGALIGPRVELAVPGTPGLLAISDFDVADVNRDGTPDLVVASAGAVISFLLGDPTDPRRMVPGAQYRPGGFPIGVAAGDLDRDGLMDYVVSLRTTWNAGPSKVVVLRGR